MKKLVVLFLALLLLAVPVSAQGYYIQDDSGLLEDYEWESLEELYAQYEQTHGFTPAVATTDSFGGLSAEDFAGACYDIQDYPEDGMLFLVSLEEGQWYIVTNGACQRRISDSQIDGLGEVLVDKIRDADYYGAFLKFPELAGELFLAGEYLDTPDISGDSVEEVQPVKTKNYGKTIAISMAVGVAIGLIAVGIMLLQMRNVRPKTDAQEYVRPGSMHLHYSRDIFLYSNVVRTPKPKSNSSSGGSRGGSGGKI